MREARLSGALEAQLDPHFKRRAAAVAHVVRSAGGRMRSVGHGPHEDGVTRWDAEWYDAGGVLDGASARSFPALMRMVRRMAAWRRTQGAGDE